ncbi:hypothetical protein ACVXHA_15845 [Escherichia coli]
MGEAPFAGGFAAMIGVAMIVGFSFQGTERSVLLQASPKIRRKTFHARYVRCSRDPLFYVFAILIISLIIPYTIQVLRNDVKDISVSSFTLVFQHAVCSLRRR